MSRDNVNLRLKVLTGLACIGVGAASAQAAPAVRAEKMSTDSFLQEVSGLQADRPSFDAGAKELSRTTGPLASETNFIFIGLIF